MPLPGVGQGDGVASEGGPSLGAEFSRENGKWLTQFVESLIDWMNHDLLGPDIGTSGTFALRQGIERLTC